LLIELISLVSVISSQKTIDCNFLKHRSTYFGRTFTTCNVYNQAIDSVGFTVASSVDSTLQRFSILDNPKVEFLPENLSEKFPSLIAVQVWNCSIKSIDEHHLKSLHESVLFSFGYNKIETIDSNAFKNNTKLEEIGLGYNKIKTLHVDLFDSLVNLKRLYLHDNQIRFIDPALFKNTTSLESINMDRNKIRFLHSETFTTLSNLKNISIDSNQLESIDGSLLANNMKLERIWFRSNKLRSIVEETFGSKPSLHYVDLRGNSCIDRSFYSSNFASMKTEIEEKCLTTIVSLKSELSIQMKVYSDQLDSLKAQMKSKDKELAGMKEVLDHCNKIKQECLNF
jgi:hypothetical protein